MMTIKEEYIALSIPAEADYINVVRLALYGITARMGFSFELIEDMKVAVSEACNNAVVHAYKSTELGMVDVKFELKQEGIQITVKDQGGSFDYKEAEKRVGPIVEDSIQDVRIGELGIYLMQSLMDDVK